MRSHCMTKPHNDCSDRCLCCETLMVVFVIEWGFMALQDNSGHIKCGQLSLSHFFLDADYKYLVHFLLPFTDNCSSSFSKRRRKVEETFS